MAVICAVLFISTRVCHHRADGFSIFISCLLTRRLLFTKTQRIRRFRHLAISTGKRENSDDACLIVADPLNCDVKLPKSATYRYLFTHRTYEPKMEERKWCNKKQKAFIKFRRIEKQMDVVLTFSLNFFARTSRYCYQSY